MSEQKTAQSLTNERLRTILIEFLTKYKVIIGLAAAVILAAAIIITGYVFVQQSRMVKANEVFEKGFMMYLQSRRAGNVLDMNQALNESVTALQEAEKKASGTPLALRAKYFLGNAFYQMKNESEAVKELKAVSEKRGFYLAPLAMYDLMVFAIEGARYDEALAYGEKFMKYWPASHLAGEAVISLSMVHRKLNDREKALSVLRDYLKANPENAYKTKITERISLLEAKVL